jgi:hypothetical protein
MSGDGTPRKAYSLSWGTELKLNMKNSDLNDDERVKKIMAYLQVP